MQLFNGTGRKLGRDIAFGFLDVFCFVLILGFVVSLALQAIMPTDDCDHGKFDRCGMRVLTDAKTGKEYLVTSKGGVIERSLDANNQ